MSLVPDDKQASSRQTTCENRAENEPRLTISAPMKCAVPCRNAWPMILEEDRGTNPTKQPLLRTKHDPKKSIYATNSAK